MTRPRQIIALAGALWLLATLPFACVADTGVPRRPCNTDLDCGIVQTCQVTEQGKACIGSCNAPTNCADASAVWQSYSNGVLPDECCAGDTQVGCIFQICTGCHTPTTIGANISDVGSVVPTTFRLDTFADTVLDGGVFLLGAQSMAASSSCLASIGVMPPPLHGSLTRDQQQIVQQWVCLGAPRLPADAGLKPFPAGADAGFRICDGSV